MLIYLPTDILTRLHAYVHAYMLVTYLHTYILIYMHTRILRNGALSGTPQLLSGQLVGGGLGPRFRTFVRRSGKGEILAAGDGFGASLIAHAAVRSLPRPASHSGLLAGSNERSGGGQVANCVANKYSIHERIRPIVGTYDMGGRVAVFGGVAVVVCRLW